MLFFSKFLLIYFHLLEVWIDPNLPLFAKVLLAISLFDSFLIGINFTVNFYQTHILVFRAHVLPLLFWLLANKNAIQLMKSGWKLVSVTLIDLFYLEKKSWHRNLRVPYNLEIHSNF
jgi:hypothetical protein